MNTIIQIETLKDVKVVIDYKSGKLGKRKAEINYKPEISDGYNRNRDGVKVTTTEHIYLLMIDNDQNCCEHWGYTETNDDIADFIGANITGVKFTDTAINTAKLEDIMDDGKIYLDEGKIQFVDFETDKGTLQFAVYNAHNGYYGHNIVFIKDDIVYLDEVL